jgi:exonuclease SbcD
LFVIKLLHTADLHLGRTFHDLSLIDDQRLFLDQITAILRDPSYRVLIIAGDVYDRSIPSPEAVRLFGSFLGALRSQNPALEIMVIPGNHDSPARLGFGRELFAELGIHFAAEPEEAFEPVIVRAAWGEGEGAGTAPGACAFFLLPFLNPGSLRAPGSGDGLGGDDPEGGGPGEDGVRGDGAEQACPGRGPQGVSAAEESAPEAGEALRSQAQLAAEAARRLELSRRRWAERGVTRAVLAAHLFAGGGRESESERIFLGGAEKVDMGLFAGFDYVALGHLHRCQRAGSNGWYAGSPLAYSFAEGDTEKVVLSVELGEDGGAGSGKGAGGGRSGVVAGADAAAGEGTRAGGIDSIDGTGGTGTCAPAGYGAARAGVVRVTPVPLRPRYRVRRLAGPFERFNHPSPQDTELKEAAGDYLEFSLSDSSLTENALPLLQGRYPRLLSVKQETARRGLASLFAGGRPAGPAGGGRRDTAADFEEFLTGLYGQAEPGKMDLFRELLARAEAEERETPELPDPPSPPGAPILPGLRDPPSPPVPAAASALNPAEGPVMGPDPGGLPP